MCSSSTPGETGYGKQLRPRATRRRRVDTRVPRGAGRPRRRPFRARRDRGAARRAPGPDVREGRDRRSPARSRRQAHRPADVAVLGLKRVGPPTSWTIWLGDPDDMAQRAEKVDGLFKRLKLKLGGRDGLDVERVRAVRGHVPAAPGGRERVLGARRGTRLLAAARRARRRILRQPLPAGDPDGAR